ncbi:protein-L-isoaspartate O-methyltransferase family protein [Enemella evansiae]|uniref:protein-L-isoaspartate O-methyltransferase family protein n=1 Tax=Enemella evansiae TaxID=2016499 RepID=UPI001E39E2B2|nr:protein-L-isoaspartate O-methyltransferase [Enemella evansiae]
MSERETSGSTPAADPVARAMQAVPRVGFLPESQRRYAAEDRPLPLGPTQLAPEQTNSQPSTVAAMLRLLDVPVGASVLDVGAGSGWTTALLAWLVGPSGRVLGLELEPWLAEQGAANLRAWAGNTGSAWARLEAAEPGVLGRPVEGPYQRILVSAMADTLPASLVDQLDLGGVLVIPVAGEMLRVTRVPAGPPRIERSGAYRFVPLR